MTAATPDDAAGGGRPVVMLVLFVLGCAAVAALAAVGLGTVWQELYGWVHDRVAGDALTG